MVCTLRQIFFQCGHASIRLLGVNVPTLAPQESCMFFDRPIDPKRHSFEPPECTDDRTSTDPERDTTPNEPEAGRREDEMVEYVCEHQRGEIERWEVMMNVCYAAHDHERHEMQRPPNARKFSNIQKVGPFALAEDRVLPLHAEQIHQKRAQPDNQTRRAAPPYNWIAEQVILGLTVGPPAHPQAPNARTASRADLRRGCPPCPGPERAHCLSSS